MTVLRRSLGRLTSAMLPRSTEVCIASTSSLSPLVSNAHLTQCYYNSRRSSPSSSRCISSSSKVKQTHQPADALVSHMDPSTLPPILQTLNGKNKTLFDHLSALPNNGVGTKVRQVKWAARGIDVPYGEEFAGPVKDRTERKDRDHLCYWTVTRVKVKFVGENRKPHGKAWGRLVWRGVPVTPEDKDEPIRGGLKFAWDVAL